MTNILSPQLNASKASLVKQQSAHSSYSINEEKILRIDKKTRIDSHLICLQKTRSLEAESYSHLRHAVENLSQPNQGVVVAVTSPGEGDGKTMTAINLAGALAKNPSAKVLLIDLDLRQPNASICDYLNLKTLTGHGIVDLITNNNLSAEQVIYYIPDINLFLTTSGAKAELPYEILKSRKLEAFIEKVRQEYDYVILDTARVNQLPDTLLISDFVDGFVIVIRADSTPRKLLEETLNSMQQEKVLGLVFNGSSLNE